MATKTTDTYFPAVVSGVAFGVFGFVALIGASAVTDNLGVLIWGVPALVLVGVLATPISLVLRRPRSGYFAVVWFVSALVLTAGAYMLLSSMTFTS